MWTYKGTKKNQMEAQRGSKAKTQAQTNHKGKGARPKSKGCYSLNEQLT